MDCYYSTMHTFRHFLFLNHRRTFGHSSFCRILEFLHSSKASNRNIYSIAYVLQTSSHNTNNTRGTGFRRAWIHTSGRRLMLDTSNSSYSSSSSNGSGDFGGVNSYIKKKAGKGKSVWVCESCGESSGQWWGVCQSCKKVDALKKFNVEDLVGSLGGGAGTRAAELRIGGYKQETVFTEHQAHREWVPRSESKDLQSQSLSDVTKGINREHWRIPMTGTFGIEVARVLGGGLVPGSLILVGGDPGVGKSTLLLQMSAILAEGCEVNKPAPVLYVSGEESVEQIASRASRMNIDTEQVRLYSSTVIEDILNEMTRVCPRAVIVDSIQTVYLRDLSGSLGSVTQVKECATALLRSAKQSKVPIFLVGHMTKSGDIAGPRVLEHIVDVVLYMEGDRLLSHRILRAVKNRFGSTDEIGVLEMGQYGLQAVTNPSELYISERNIHQDILTGLALTVIIDGSRPFLIETQALCCTGRSPGTSMMTRFNGIEEKRANIIIAVLVKQAGLDLYGSSIFVNVVGGVRVEETAADLAIAASICSSFMEIPIPVNMAFIGEIGLGGELRTVARMDKRITELAKLGFTKCVIPHSSHKSLSSYDSGDLSIIFCKNLREVIKVVFDRVVNPIPTLIEVIAEGEGEQKGVERNVNPIPTIVEVIAEGEGEGEQKGVDARGVASEKQGQGEQKHASMGAGEKNNTSITMGVGETHGVSARVGGDKSTQRGEGQGRDWTFRVAGNVVKQKRQDRKPQFVPQVGGEGGSGGFGQQKGMDGRTPHYPYSQELGGHMDRRAPPYPYSRDLGGHRRAEKNNLDRRTHPSFYNGEDERRGRH